MDFRLVSRFGLVVVMLVVAAVEAGQVDLDRFFAAHPGARVLEHGDRVSTVFGAAFSHAASPEASAHGFLVRHAGLLGTSLDELTPVGAIPGAPHVQPVRFDRATGSYRFSAMYFEQQLEGVPVFRARLVLLVRNEPGFPLVLASSDLRDLAGFEVDQPDGQPLRELARRAIAGRVHADSVVSAPRHVIWAGTEDLPAEPRLAITFTTERQAAAPQDYEKWLFVADAASGAVLLQESQVFEVDITGSVDGRTTQGDAADFCGPEVATPLPYALVRIGTTTAFADADGDFVIPHTGEDPVTVESPVKGEFFSVFNQGGPDTVLSIEVTPPGPAEFLHNETNGSELLRAEVNAYLHANIVRDFTLRYSPAYPGIVFERAFPVNVNINASCNAFYNGSSINFYTSGGGCANTAFSTVVHHEYGHHIVNSGGSGQGAYGEGMSDVMGVLITDSPLLGLGFTGNCNGALRNADNSVQYPCEGGIHSCGRLLSGCVWDLRNELLAVDPVNYRDILASLAVNAVLVHNGSSITPDIFIHYLTLDDDDADIGNGTPHHVEIEAAFDQHNMTVPYLRALDFQYPDGRPEQLEPGVETSFRVRLVELAASAVPNSGELHYSTDGSTFQTIAMTQIGEDEYEAILPAFACGTVVRFYVSAEALFYGTVTDPVDAPAATYRALAAGAVTAIAVFDFENASGWTVENINLDDGAWEAGVPVPFGDPPLDFDGSGQCFVTGNDRPAQDVDGGPTRLISPVLDLSAAVDPFLSYARWVTSDAGDDRLTVEISSDGGVVWRAIEVAEPTDAWAQQTVRIIDHAGLTDSVVLRFSIDDSPANSHTEAGLDAVEIFDLECGAERYTTESFRINAGVRLQGGLADLQRSDDFWLVVQQRPSVTPFTPALEVELETTSAIVTAEQLTFTVELFVAAIPAVVPQRIDIWNAAESRWENVDQRIGSDDEIVIDLVETQDPSRFIDPGSGRVRTRLRWFDPGNLLNPAWGVGIDFARWSVIPQ